MKAPRGFKLPSGLFPFNLSCSVGANLKKEGSQMHTILIIGSIIFFLFSGQAFAQPIAKQLLDAKPQEGLLLDVEKWFQEHPIKGRLTNFETVFKSPRGEVLFLRAKGAYLASHSHSQVDELVYIYKGRGEVYLNGKWVPCQAGEFHTAPRGVAHALRTDGVEELWLICIFTDPIPPLGDRVMINE